MRIAYNNLDTDTIPYQQSLFTELALFTWLVYNAQLLAWRENHERHYS